MASNSKEHLHGSLLVLAGEVVNTHGPVEPDKDNIRQEPYTLPQGFTWDALDLGDRGVVSTGGSAHSWWAGVSVAPLAVPGLDCPRWFWGQEPSPHQAAQWSQHLLGVRWGATLAQVAREVGESPSLGPGALSNLL